MLGRRLTLRENLAAILVPGPMAPHQQNIQGKEGCVLVSVPWLSPPGPPKQLFILAVGVSLVMGPLPYALVQARLI